LYLLNYNSQDVSIPADLKHRLEHELAMDQRSKNDKLRGSHASFISASRKASYTPLDNDLLEKIRDTNRKLGAKLPVLDLRLKNAKFIATNHFEDDPNQKYEQVDNKDGPRRAKQDIQTIQTAGVCFKLFRKIKRIVTTGRFKDYTQDTTIMENVNLVFEPGKMVLLLGGPGSGKSTLLRYIANILPKGKDYKESGELTLSGVSPTSTNINWSSLVGFMDQIDRLHAYLTGEIMCAYE